MWSARQAHPLLHCGLQAADRSRSTTRPTEAGAKGALLRREGLYSWHVVEWRRAQQAGALEALDRTRGRKPADQSEQTVVGKPSPGRER